MSREIRSRRAGPDHDQPLYARMLRLRHLAPSGLLCFVFLEGAVVLGILLALAELVSWWGVLVLPLTVALMVKLNDVVAGQLVKAVPEELATGIPPARSASAGSPIRPAAVGLLAGPAAAGSPAPPALPPPTVTVRTRVDLSRYPTVDLREHIAPDGRESVDASALNGPPSSRQWAEELNLREQRARQSAARRYE